MLRTGRGIEVYSSRSDHNSLITTFIFDVRNHWRQLVVIQIDMKVIHTETLRQYVLTADNQYKNYSSLRYGRQHLRQFII